jgi:flagellar transcriptional activator FlhD
MTRDSQTLDSIRELNLSYLLLAQRLLINEGEEAQTRLGLSAEIAQTLTQLSPAQTAKLASSSQVLCFFRLGGDALLQGLAALTQRTATVANESLLVA